MIRLSPRHLLTMVLSLALAFAASAAELSPPRNLSELAIMSDAVVLARAGASTVEPRGPLLFTATGFAVERAVAGGLSRGEGFQVEVPGGTFGSWGWMVPGAPRFTPGVTYLLFLQRREGRRFQPRMLAYGVLEETSGVRGFLLQPVEEAADLQVFTRPDGEEAEGVGVYDEEALLGLLERAAASGERLSAREALAPGDQAAADRAESAPSICAFMGGNGINVRWNIFDTGGSTSMAAQASGDATLDGGGFTQVQNAIGAWMGVPGTSLKVSYAGTSTFTLSCSGSGPHQPPAGTNIIVFNDPCSDIPDLSNCGGTLAFGGPWFNTTTTTFDGTPWYPAIGWYVMVNNGTGACLGATNYQLMVEHELGHGLGFGHVSDPNALMNAFCCHPMDGTDITCAQYLYPTSLPVTPPAIGAISAVSGPFRLKISGANFHAGCRVEINGAAVPQTVFKSATLVQAKSGAALKAMVPTGTPVLVRVRNLDDGGLSASFTYMR